MLRGEGPLIRVLKKPPSEWAREPDSRRKLELPRESVHLMATQSGPLYATILADAAIGFQRNHPITQRMYQNVQSVSLEYSVQNPIYSVKYAINHILNAIF